MAEIKDPENTLILDTTKGKVVIEMLPDLAPGHVGRIKELAREGVLFFQDDGQCPSVAHDEESLELTTRAVRAVARRLPAGERTATPVAETLARYAAMRGIRSPRVRRPRSDAPADER